MRLHQDPVFIGRTPAASVTIPMFQEINRTVHLVRPTVGGDPLPGFVDQYQRTGTQYRVHRPVLQADKTVTVLPHIPAIQKTQPGFSPVPDEMTKKCSGV
jgi:hypothetical protein